MRFRRCNFSNKSICPFTIRYFFAPTPCTFHAVSMHVLNASHNHDNSVVFFRNQDGPVKTWKLFWDMFDTLRGQRKSARTQVSRDRVPVENCTPIRKHVMISALNFTGAPFHAFKRGKRFGCPAMYAGCARRPEV